MPYGKRSRVDAEVRRLRGFSTRLPRIAQSVKRVLAPASCFSRFGQSAGVRRPLFGGLISVAPVVQ